MTEEELNRFEEMSLDVGRCIGMAHNAILSLIRLARVGLAVTPRPISEAPRDGTYVYAWHHVHNAWIAVRPISIGWWSEKTYTTRWPEEAFTHFIPLSALPKPGGE